MYRILRIKTTDIDNQELTIATIDDGSREYQTMDGIHTFEDDSAAEYPNLEATLKRLKIPFDSYSIKEGESDHGNWYSYRPLAEEEYGSYNTSGDYRPKGWKQLEDC